MKMKRAMKQQAKQRLITVEKDATQELKSVKKMDTKNAKLDLQKALKQEKKMEDSSLQSLKEDMTHKLKLEKQDAVKAKAEAVSQEKAAMTQMNHISVAKIKAQDQQKRRSELKESQTE